MSNLKYIFGSNLSLVKREQSCYKKIKWVTQFCFFFFLQQKPKYNSSKKGIIKKRMRDKQIVLAESKEKQEKKRFDTM